MCSVFRKGDVVFHTHYGECIVVRQPGDETVRVYPKLNKHSEFTDWVDCFQFSPWPKPNHERPFTEVGWWIVSFSDGSYGCRWRVNRTEHRLYQDKGTLYTWSEQSYVKFLGTEL